MKGIAILVHSVRLLLNNVDVAMRISLVPYIALAAINAYVQAMSAKMANAILLPNAVPSGGEFFQVFLLSAVAVVLSLWIAVAWHRFVLTGERPSGFIPVWHGGSILSYFGYGLVIGLIVSAFAMLVLLSVGSFVPEVFAFFVMVVVALVIFYRLCAVLPAVAVGEKLSLRDAWAATKGQTSTIVVLAVVGGVLLLILQAPTSFGDGPNSTLSMIYSAVIGWFTMLIGASVLTTFYGHFVHGHTID